ncbi:MAG: SufE family protein [Bacteroidetes bacterium]|nr:MAG: SufE family protein [Bacteroidota bacterium]
MKINEIQDEIIEEFALFDNKNDTYNYIIELGKKLVFMPENYKIEQNLIKGCQSRVWLFPELHEDKIQFFADSDSTIVKGIISLLVRVLDQQYPADILTADLYFIDKIGLQSMLSMNRSNGLLAMIKQIKMYALAFESVQK